MEKKKKEVFCLFCFSFLFFLSVLVHRFNQQVSAKVGNSSPLIPVSTHPSTWLSCLDRVHKDWGLDLVAFTMFILAHVRDEIINMLMYYHNAGHLSISAGDQHRLDFFM